MVHVFGSGHSRILVEEMWPRYGSFPGFNPIVELSLSGETERTMRRMEKVTGRTDDMIILRGVNLFPTQIEELILKQPELTAHYLLEVTRPDALDELMRVVDLTDRMA